MRISQRRTEKQLTSTFKKHRRAAGFAACLLMAGFSCVSSSAEDYRSGEYELKAAILFNLMKFVEWPAAAYPGAQAPTVLCTLGRDPFGSTLDEYSGNSVNGRRLAIRRLQRDVDPQGCQLMYISSSERNRLPQVLRNLQSAPILTVADMDQFAARGGMIQLTLEDKQVHFAINLNAISREKLRIRSNLLALARIVESDITSEAKGNTIR